MLSKIEVWNVSIIHELVKDIPLPKMVKIRQTFDRTQIEDVAQAVWAEWSQSRIRARI